MHWFSANMKILILTHVIPWKCFDWRHREEWVWTDGCPDLGSDRRRVPGMQFTIVAIAVHIFWLHVSDNMLLTQRRCSWRMLQLITRSITLALHVSGAFFWSLCGAHSGVSFVFRT
jgi:hypothetical protein